MNLLYIILGLALLFVVFTYNALVNMRNRAKEALSDIDVQLKRRFDLIPNLVQTVKGYVQHEKQVLENVTKARADVAGNGGDPLQREQAENMLSNTLKTLFAVAENYPDLKANANFLDLQRELADTENKIQASRRFYNTTVKDLNTKVESFPANLIVGMLGFKQMEFFKTETSAEKEPIKVEF
ncbi:MAG: LemA family protein [Candidatus Colwellbacteria bacterium]